MDSTHMHDDPERRKMPARLVAARDIAVVERNWSASRAFDDGNEFAGLPRDERIQRLGAHLAFYELIEVQGAPGEADVILELFAENADLANATLERVEMNGSWSAADAFERELMGMVFDAGYKGSISRIARTSDAARRTITIPAGFTQEHGFVALRRKRTLLTAEHFDGESAVRPHIEIDKVSTFALDIAKLTHLSDPAAEEVRLIVASTIYKAINWRVLEANFARGDIFEDMLSQWQSRTDPARLHMSAEDMLESALQDFYNLGTIMQRNGISLDQVRYRAFDIESPTELHDPEGQAFIEEALHVRSDLLTPAATTYYVHS